MCGIAGILGSLDRDEPAAALIRKMIGAQRHRGPDEQAYHLSAALQLGVCRLSVVDLATGTQPIYSEAGDKCIVFNGEIYNHRELREWLIGRGHTFRSRTDTEVILHLYEEQGTHCVNALRGMFSFAIADGPRLFLARDRIGIKPLYYAVSDTEPFFVFASEIKALLCAVSPSLNEQAVGDGMLLGYVPGDSTYFSGIRSLPPGSFMLVSSENGKVRIDRVQYYSSSVNPDDKIDLAGAQEELEVRLRNVVYEHLAADVPIGITLSGGVDSTLLALLAREHCAYRPVAFTVADDPNQADVRLSKRVAAQLGMEHDITVYSFEEYLRKLPFIALAEEQPTSLFPAYPVDAPSASAGGLSKGTQSRS